MTVRGLHTTVCGHQAGVRGLQTTVCGDQAGVRGLQTTVCGHQAGVRARHTTVRRGQTTVCRLHATFCRHPMVLGRRAAGGRGHRTARAPHFHKSPPLYSGGDRVSFRKTLLYAGEEWVVRHPWDGGGRSPKDRPSAATEGRGCSAHPSPATRRNARGRRFRIKGYSLNSFNSSLSIFFRNFGESAAPSQSAPETLATLVKPGTLNISTASALTEADARYSPSGENATP